MSSPTIESPREFSAENLKRCKNIIAKYEVPKCALLPVLYIAQEQFGYLDSPVLNCVAKLLDIPLIKVYEAVSFYTLFKKKDMGKWCLQICNNVTCTMMGSEKLIEVAKNELGISFHEVTPDNQFSLVPVQCLGACDKAPVVQINDDYFENLDENKFNGVIQKLKRSPERVNEITR